MKKKNVALGFMQWTIRPLLLRPAMGASLIAVFLITVIPNLIFSIVAPGHSVVGKSFGTDDAYYYFQIAHNIASGYGSSFDQITKTNGFHPLWLLTSTPIFALAQLNHILPLRVVLIFISLLHFGSIALILLSLERFGIRRLAGFSAVILFLLSPGWDQILNSGMETALNFFLLSLFVYQLSYNLHKGIEFTGKNGSFTGTIAGLLFLARLDNCFVIPVLTFFFFAYLLYAYRLSWNQSISIGIKYFTPLVAIVFTYCLISQLYYGGIVPVSGQVKMYWHSIGGSVFGNQPQSFIDLVLSYFSNQTQIVSGKPPVGPVAKIAGILPFDNQSYFVSWAIIIPFVFFFFYKGFVLKYLTLSLLLASIIHTLYYAVVGHVQAQSGYWVIEYLTFLLFIALGLDSFLSVLRIKNGTLVASIAVLLLLLAMSWPRYASHIAGKFEFSPTDGSYYFERALFLKNSTPQDAVIGTPNAGGLGYFTNRRIVNIDGLVNSYEFLEHMKTQTSSLYLKQIGVNYIFIASGYDEYEPYTSMLSGQLELVSTWTNANGGQAHYLFKYGS